MSGPQFLHLQSYSRKANTAGQSVDQVLDEADRVPVFSKHVAEPKQPVLVYGASIEELRRLHDTMVANGGVEVTLKDGRKARRGIRKDRHTLMTVVASHPFPTELVVSDDEARSDFERWRDHNIAWLKARFGDNLVSVIEHWDEAHPHLHAYILPLGDPSCSARHLNPAWCAKEEAMEAARAIGSSDKDALKLGNAAYRSKAREIQDCYYQEVGLPCGLTRVGPKRRRLSRQQWAAEKDAARREARLLRDMDRRMDGLTEAEEGLERELACKVEEIAEKLDLADAALVDAEADRNAARSEREAAERIRQTAARDAEAERQALMAQHRDAIETDRANLRNAKSELARETAQLHQARNDLEVERARTVRETAAQAAKVVLKLVMGVLDGTVRLGTDGRSWVIEDDDLREETIQTKAIDLITVALTALHEAWVALTNRLMGPEQVAAAKEVAAPVKKAIDHSNSSGPSR